MFCMVRSFKTLGLGKPSSHGIEEYKSTFKMMLSKHEQLWSCAKQRRWCPMTGSVPTLLLSL